MPEPRWKWVPNYATMYYISLALLVASMPLSKYTMSLFQFATLFFWLWHGVDVTFSNDFQGKNSQRALLFLHFLAHVLSEMFKALIIKFRQFFQNKPAVVLSSIFLLHIFGLIYTTDYSYALKDLRTKLPIFILPLFLSTGPKLETKVLYRILAVFVMAVVGGCIYRLVLFLNVDVTDTRLLNTHTSHIRFSLNAVFAIFILLYFAYQNRKNRKAFSISLYCIAAGILTFLVYMDYSTGIILFAGIGALMGIYYAWKIPNRFLKWGILVTVCIFSTVPVIYVSQVIYSFHKTPSVVFSTLDKKTVSGNYYYHDTVNFKPRNGQWTGLYICDKELRQSWSKRSALSLDSLDGKKQLTRFTLIRYLASKDLRKDSAGVSHLTDSDIQNIENGVSEIKEDRLFHFRAQLEDFLIGLNRYKNYHDPNSGSMVQRFEYWRTSLMIIKLHPVFGVGTGDVPQVFENQYRKENSLLNNDNRLRAHNQYLSVTVAFGIFGLLWFLLALFYPGLKTRSFNNYFYLIYWLIFMASMLTEDTIESQEGVTFFILFAAIFILGREKTEISENLF